MPILKIIIVAVCFLTSACVSAETRVETGPFPVTVDERGDVDAALARAQTSDRLALVVIGANWCHDSKALMEKLDDPATEEILATKYELVLINVENFEHGFDTASRFGLPIYAHTPTMLIIDPATEDLVNWDDHYQFRDSYKMKLEEVTTYLEEHADASVMLPMPAEGRDEVDIWADDIASRIEAGYAEIRKFDEFEGDDFRDVWSALQPLRYSYSEDYPAALLRVAEDGDAGELPVYEALPWE